MNSITKSNDLAIQMCNGNYRYLYGAKNIPYTKENVYKLALQYPSVYTDSLIKEALKDADKGYIGIDCSGFVCDVLGISQKGSANLYDTAVKKLDVTKANAKAGMVLYKKGHVAYIGKNLNIYEAASTKSDLKVSTFASRCGGFTSLLIVKDSKLATTLVKSKKYFDKYAGKSESLVDALNSLGIDSSFDYRASIAMVNGYSSYSGLCGENLFLLSLLKKGKLIIPC